MPRILYSSLPPNSERRLGGFVEAPDLRSATDILSAQGHRDVRFHRDPSMGDSPGTDPHIALALVAPHESRVLSSILLSLPSLALGTFVISSLVLFATGHWEIALVALAMAIGVFWTWLPVRLHATMRLAMSTRRYDRARRLLSVLRFMIRGGPAGVLLGDLLVTEEARIHAGAGQMERALEVLGQLRDGGPREELYQMSIPSLYDHARDYEGMLTVQRELAARRPNDPNPHLDLALLLALRFGAPSAARESLACAKELPKTELAVAFGQLSEGIVLFLEGQGEHAIERLGTARAFFETQPPSMTRGLVALATAHLARSFALLGRHEEAEAELRRASPVLLEE